MHTRRFYRALAALFCLSLLSCEDVSVSVNKKGQVALTRSEGVFAYDPAQGRVSLIDWNYGNAEFPVIVRWAPDGESLAFTVRSGSGNQDASVYLVKKDGTGKSLLYETAKIVSQMEWSPDGRFLSLATAGEDTEMSVADLGVLTVADGEWKTVATNTGDVHAWTDKQTLACVKLTKKNPDNGDLFQGQLILLNVSTGKERVLTPLVAGKSSEVRSRPGSDEILFTAIEASEEEPEFTEGMAADPYVYRIRPGEAAQWISDRVVTYIGYSPDGKKVLIKAKGEDSVDLALLDPDTSEVTPVVENIPDTVNVSQVDAKVIPAWLDNGTVLFWKVANTYGASGQSIRFMSCSLATGKIVNHQVAIDSLVDKMVQSKGGY